jgi:hypothetical protein
MDGLDVVCPRNHTLHSQRLSDMVNRPLITNELVWIWKITRWSSRIQEIADHFWRIYEIFLGSIKENRKMSTCNQLDLESLGSGPICPAISLDTVFHGGEVSWNVAKHHRVKLQPAQLELSTPSTVPIEVCKPTLHSVGFLSFCTMV